MAGAIKDHARNPSSSHHYREPTKVSSSALDWSADVFLDQFHESA